MNEIDRIRKSVNIIDIASQYTTLKKRRWAGREKYISLCPFHEEKNPSFTVDETKQLYHCFGCGEGGDIFSLIMKKKKMDFESAINYLGKRIDNE